MVSGAIGATQISGSLDAKNIVMDLIVKQLKLSNLSELATTVQVPELTGTIPVLGPGGIQTDLKEWEMGLVKSGDFSYVSFDLTKDRVKLMVSDEARFKSKMGDPLALQKAGASLLLAQELDRKIAVALQTTPQTSATAGAWSTVTNNPLKDIATAVAGLKPYKADFVIMTSNVWAQFVGNNYTAQYSTGNPGAVEGAIARIPGLNLDVYISDDITAKTILVGSRSAPAVVIGNGPVKVRQEDVMDGGEIWQIDVYRQVKSTILKTSGNLNMGVYQITGVIA